MGYDKRRRQRATTARAPLSRGIQISPSEGSEKSPPSGSLRGLGGVEPDAGDDLTDREALLVLLLDQAGSCWSPRGPRGVTRAGCDGKRRAGRQEILAIK